MSFYSEEIKHRKIIMDSKDIILDSNLTSKFVLRNLVLPILLCVFTKEIGDYRSESFSRRKSTWLRKGQ